jgi:fumarylacetoacetase
VRPPGPAFGVCDPPGGVCLLRGDEVLDLAGLGLEPFAGAAAAFAAPTLGPFMAAGREAWAATLDAVEGLRPEPFTRPAAEVAPRMPFAVGDYADFYASEHHAANLGRILRPGTEPLLPNWRHLPVGYHGRAGTVVPSGTPVVRPCGQYLDGDAPAFGPSRRLDVELELGFVIGTPSPHGRRVLVDEALEHVFGVVLLNDWSARDIQAWEYRPLGPFLGKSFATSISAWVTPLLALEGDRIALPPHEPPPLDYLREPPWALDLGLELELNGTVVSRPSARHLSWSPAQMVAHLTANGASLRTGDLLGSGTISGPAPGERGSLVELSWDGAEPLALGDGSTRSFLLDGDEVVMRGDGLAPVTGRILPAEGSAGAI